MIERRFRVWYERSRPCFKSMSSLQVIVQLNLHQQGFWVGAEEKGEASARDGEEGFKSQWKLRRRNGKPPATLVIRTQFVADFGYQGVGGGLRRREQKSAKDGIET